MIPLDQTSEMSVLPMFFALFLKVVPRNVGNVSFSQVILHFFQESVYTSKHQKRKKSSNNLEKTDISDISVPGLQKQAKNLGETDISDIFGTIGVQSQ